MPPYRPRLKDTTGCLVCRERRKKCDYTRPECAACVRIGKICRWPGDNLAAPNEYVSNTRKSQWAIFDRSTRCRDGNSLPPRELGLAAWKPDLCVAYYFNVRWKGANFAPVPHEHGLQLSFRIPAMLINNSSTLASNCLEACALFFFGKTHQMEDIRREGLNRYSESMVSVAGSLQNPESLDYLETIVAIYLLSLFEVEAPISNSSWTYHMLGLGLLMKNLGPHAMTKLPNRLLFEHLRISLILAAIWTRQSTFLSSEKWKTVPWQSCRLEKGYAEKLMDIMADVPTFLEQLDFVQASVNGSLKRCRHKCEMILNRQRRAIQSAFEQLDEWIQSLEADSRFSNWQWEVDSTLPSPYNSDLPFGKATNFKTLSAGVMMSYYQATRILLCRAAADINKLAPKVDLIFVDCGEDHSDLVAPVAVAPSTIILSDEHLARTAQDASLQTYQYVEFALQPAHCGAGGTFFTIPLTLAYYNLGNQESSEGRWLANVLASICARAGHWKAPSLFMGRAARDLCQITIDDEPSRTL